MNNTKFFIKKINIIINGKKIRKFSSLNILFTRSVKLIFHISKDEFVSNKILIKKGMLPSPIISNRAANIKQKYII